MRMGGFQVANSSSKLMKTDPQKPSTWKPYRNGMCDGCWSGCCTLPLEASAYDLIRLELITEDEAAVSLKKVAKKDRSPFVMPAIMITAIRCNNLLWPPSKRLTGLSPTIRRHGNAATVKIVLFAVWRTVGQASSGISGTTRPLMMNLIICGRSISIASKSRIAESSS